MRLALQVIAFNVDPWINQMLQNAAPFVDKIFIAYPPRPWSYSLKARNKEANPTSLSSINLNTKVCDVEVIHGDWKYDEDTRNTLLDLARKEEFDWMIIQDADEFYSESSWRKLIKVLLQESQTCTDLIITPWVNFWKSTEYVLQNDDGTIKSPNEGFAIKCSSSDRRFVYSRSTNALHPMFIDETCFHYGYVMSDAQMQFKIKTWAHTKDIFSPRLWYILKWKYWHQDTKNLHPGSPYRWPRATKYLAVKPDFYLKLKHIENTVTRSQTIYIRLLDAMWNVMSTSKRVINISKQALNSFRKAQTNHLSRQ